MRQFLDFEKPVAELETKIVELQTFHENREAAGPDIRAELKALRAKADSRLRQIYAKLTAHQKVQVARHAQRPHARDYIEALTTEFTPLAGDRTFGEDEAMIGGLARFEGAAVMVIGTERGHDMESRVRHNFGMARPEGYRKAQRLMKLAERFRLPVLSFVDTAGAWPGIEAEARGQAEAIARSVDVLLGLGVPTIAVIIGEGGSGGAIAIAASDRVLMLEHAVYSVISPEAAASILWRDPKLAAQAAEALKLTAVDLKRLGLVDRIVPEPLGGAHRAPQEIMAGLRMALAAEMKELLPLDSQTLLLKRRERFLEMTRAAK